MNDNEAAAAAYLAVVLTAGAIGFLSGIITAYCYWVRLGGRLPL